MNTFKELISSANILVNDKKYDKAVEQYKQALTLTEVSEQNIDIYNTLGRLFLSQNKIEEAIKSFESSLEIHNNIPEQKAKQLIVNKATILNNIGVIKLKTNLDQAIKYHKEALEIFSNITEHTPDVYTIHLANTHYSLGDAYYLKKDFYMAKKHFKSAIKLYKPYEKNFSVQPFIANAHYNLGNIYTDETNVYDARNNYLKALKIFRSLADKHPKSYTSLVAATFNNLAVTAKTMYKYSDAITYYKNALKEYEKIISDDRSTFLPFYAATLNSLGIIYTEQQDIKDDYASEGLSSFSGFGSLSATHSEKDKKEEISKQQKEKAAKYYKQALVLYDELAEKEPETYTHYVATCLHNLGILFDEKKDYKKAEEFYGKALKLRRYLADKNEKAFNLDTCVTLLNIVTMYQTLLEETGEIRVKDESNKILDEIETRLSCYTDSDKPILLSMRSDLQYFKEYFNSVDKEFLDVLEVIRNANYIEEEIKEYIAPSKKLELHKNIINIFEAYREKYPKNNRLLRELLYAFVHHSWLALRNKELKLAQESIDKGLKIDPNSLALKANQAHLFMINNKVEKAKKIYLSINDKYNSDNENLKNIIKADLNILRNDGVLKIKYEEIKKILSE